MALSDMFYKEAMEHCQSYNSRLMAERRVSKLSKCNGFVSVIVVSHQELTIIWNTQKPVGYVSHRKHHWKPQSSFDN